MDTTDAPSFGSHVEVVGRVTGPGCVAATSATDFGDGFGECACAGGRRCVHRRSCLRCLLPLDLELYGAALEHVRAHPSHFGP